MDIPTIQNGMENKNKEYSLLMDLFIDIGIGDYVGKVNMDRNTCDTLCENTLVYINDTIEIINEYSNKSNLVKIYFLRLLQYHILKMVLKLSYH